MTDQERERIRAVSDAWERKLIDFDSANPIVHAQMPQCVNHPKVKAAFVRGIQRTPLCEACYDEAEDLR